MPTFWNQVGYHSSQLWQGGWESVQDLGLLVREQNGVRVLWDPYGALEAKRALIAGLYTSLQDPKQFAKDLIDWDTWATSPARAIGHMAPDAAIALLTAGGGAVTLRGTRAAASGAAATTGRATAATVAEQVALDSARRGLRQAVSGFWRDRVSSTVAEPELGQLDISAFFPNAKTPEWVYPKMERADQHVARFEVEKPYVAQLFEGQRLNLARVGEYEFDEVTIRQPDGSVRYLDSYTPDDVLVSRKITQLAEVSEQHARAQIREFLAEVRRRPSWLHDRGHTSKPATTGRLARADRSAAQRPTIARGATSAPSRP